MDKEQIEERRNKVAAALAEAEGALKLAERVSGDVALPAVNQLRYALCHLLEDDFEAAIRHCVRARYDAYEASIGYFLDYIATFFEQDYPVLEGISDCLYRSSDCFVRDQEVARCR